MFTKERVTYISILFFLMLLHLTPRSISYHTTQVISRPKVYFSSYPTKSQDNLVYVNSIHELRRLNCQVGTKVATLGYYSKFDKISGLYTITKDPTTKDNSGSIIKLHNGLTAKLVTHNGRVSVKQFGALGNGKHDDTSAIQNALNSGISNIIFSNGEYKLTDYLMISKNNLNIYGNNSTLFTDNSYRTPTNFYEWLVNIRGNNVMMKDITIEARETIKVGYKTQLGILNATDIHIDHCNFIIPKTVLSKESKKDVEYSNIDLYSNWHNVTIENCKLEALSDSDAGCCIMARDYLKRSSSGLIFQNNQCKKISHDEILFLTGKGGTVENVQIRNNSFTMDELKASPSHVSMSLGTSDAKKTNGVIFENNTVNCKSSFTLMTFGNSTNVLVQNNNIRYKKSGSLNGSVVFTQGRKTKNITVKKNVITLQDCNQTGISHLNDSSASFLNNTIVIHCNITDSLFSTGTTTAQNNTIKANKKLGMIGNNIYDFRNNRITLTKISNTLFQYYNHTLTKKVTISNNDIQYKGQTKPQSTLLMINQARLNNFPITVSNNKIRMTGKNNSLYYLSLTDKTPQSLIFKKNNLNGFKKPTRCSSIEHNIKFQ